MSPRAVLLLLFFVTSFSLSVPAEAEGFLVFHDDRQAFEDSLVRNPGSTVVDSHGAFAPDPATGSGRAVVTRTGAIGGQSFAYDAYDVDFAGAPPGFLVPGQTGGDIADLDNVDVESPAAQGGATGSGSWGLDGASGSSATRNALLLDFTATPGGLGIGHFGADLVDWEATAAFTRAELRLYAAGALVFSHFFDWQADDGNGAVHFLGVVAIGDGAGSFFDQVALVLGDDGPGGGNSERWAADRFTFGRAVATPEPSTLSLAALGILALGLGVWRRRRRAVAAVGQAPGEGP